MNKASKSKDGMMSDLGGEDPSLVALREAHIDQAEYLRLRIEEHLEAWAKVLTAEELALLRSSLLMAVAADPHVDQLCCVLVGEGDEPVT